MTCSRWLTHTQVDVEQSAKPAAMMVQPELLPLPPLHQQQQLRLHESANGVVPSARALMGWSVASASSMGMARKEKASSCLCAAIMVRTQNTHSVETPLLAYCSPTMSRLVEQARAFMPTSSACSWRPTCTWSLGQGSSGMYARPSTLNSFA